MKTRTYTTYTTRSDTNVTDSNGFRTVLHGMHQDTVRELQPRIAEELGVPVLCQQLLVRPDDRDRCG